MEKVVFKQPLWARIVDILMYLFGLGFVVVLSYFALQHFFGLEGVYGIPTVYLTAVIGGIVLLLIAKSVISDAKLRVEVENMQITIIEDKNPQTFDIRSSGFEFESHIYSGDSQHFLTILDPSDQKHVFDISGLGQIEVQELKALISSIQKPAPNKIQTQED